MRCLRLHNLALFSKPLMLAPGCNSRWLLAWCIRCSFARAVAAEAGQTSCGGCMCWGRGRVLWAGLLQDRGCNKGGRQRACATVCTCSRWLRAWSKHVGTMFRPIVKNCNKSFSNCATNVDDHVGCVHRPPCLRFARAQRVWNVKVVDWCIQAVVGTNASRILHHSSC